MAQARGPRPLSPHLEIWRWGPAMLVSILHRITGNGLAFAGLGLLLWWVSALAGGPESYQTFLDEWHAIARDLMDWDVSDPAAALCGNVAHYLLEGMAYGQVAGQLKENEISQMLSFAKSVMASSSTARDDALRSAVQGVGYSS